MECARTLRLVLLILPKFGTVAALGADYDRNFEMRALALTGRDMPGEEIRYGGVHLIGLFDDRSVARVLDHNQL